MSIETIPRFGAGRDTWLNLSGGIGNELVTSLSVTSKAPQPQGVAIRLVLQDGTPMPVMNARALRPNQTVRFRLPAVFLAAGQYMSCYSSELTEWNMMLSRVSGGRPGTNRLSHAPGIGAWTAISAPNSPMEIRSVLCVNKTEAEARVGLRFRSYHDGATGLIFSNETIPARQTYRATFVGYPIRDGQWLDVFSTCDCAWIISGVGQ